MNTDKKQVGSSFDDFLSDEHFLEESDAVAIKRVVAYQIKDAMKKKHLSKSALATKMKTSRSSVE